MNALPHWLDPVADLDAAKATYTDEVLQLYCGEGETPRKILFVTFLTEQTDLDPDGYIWVARYYSGEWIRTRTGTPRERLCAPRGKVDPYGFKYTIYQLIFWAIAGGILLAALAFSGG